MEQEQTHTTLRDYLAVMKRRRLVILACGLIGGTMALALSLTSDPVYEARSALRVIPPGESLVLAGTLPAQAEAATQTAAQAAEIATRESVMTAVRDELGLEESIDALQDRVVASQEQSNLVAITASASGGEVASELANAVADEAVRSTNIEAREQFAKYAEEFLSQIEEVPEDNTARRNFLEQQAARMQSLATVVELAEVVDRASAPSGPVSPRPVRNVIIGAFFGLLIGFAASGLMETLDRRLRRPEDVHRLLELPLLGLVGERAMGRLPTDETEVEHQIASMDAYRRLRTNIGYLNRESAPRSILVTSSAPGEGKTTVSAGLALASALSGRRTLLVEADFHRPVHANRLGLKKSPGLAEFLAGNADPSGILQVHSFSGPAPAGMNGSRAHAEKATLTCITAGAASSYTAEGLASEAFAQFIAEVSEVYDLVVIDSAPLLAAAETLEIASDVDAVLLCARLDQTTSEQAVSGLDALRRLPERPTGLVVTGARGEDGGYGYYSYAYAYASPVENPTRGLRGRR